MRFMNITNNPIFISGIQRSGATIIAKLLKTTGIFYGDVNNTMENIEINNLIKEFYVNLQLNPNGQYPLPVLEDFENVEKFDSFDYKVHHVLMQQGHKRNKQWVFKSSKIIQTIPIWYMNFPTAKYIIVRRKPVDVVESCIKTGYMTAFKDKVICDYIGVADESAGWYWWIKEQEELLIKFLQRFKIDYRVLWPERLAEGDYSQFNETLQWLGLDWNNEILKLGSKLLWKSKYNERSKK